MSTPADLLFGDDVLEIITEINKKEEAPAPRQQRDRRDNNRNNYDNNNYNNNYNDNNNNYNDNNFHNNYDNSHNDNFSSRNEFPNNQQQKDFNDTSLRQPFSKGESSDVRFRNNQQQQQRKDVNNVDQQQRQPFSRGESSDVRFRNNQQQQKDYDQVRGPDQQQQQRKDVGNVDQQQRQRPDQQQARPLNKGEGSDVRFRNNQQQQKDYDQVREPQDQQQQKDANNVDQQRPRPFNKGESSDVRVRQDQQQQKDVNNVDQQQQQRPDQRQQQYGPEWRCPSCMMFNRSFRQVCFKCYQPKPRDSDPNQPFQKGVVSFEDENEDGYQPAIFTPAVPKLTVFDYYDRRKLAREEKAAQILALKNEKLNKKLEEKQNKESNKNNEAENSKKTENDAKATSNNKSSNVDAKVPTEAKLRLWVSGLSENVNEQDLTSLFQRFGHVCDTSIARQKLKPTRTCRGFGHVTMEFNPQFTFESCQKALNKTRWKGGTLHVERAKGHYKEKLRKAEEEYNAQQLREQEKKKRLKTQNKYPTEWRLIEPGVWLPVLRQKLPNGRMYTFDPAKRSHIRTVHYAPTFKPTPLRYLTWNISHFGKFVHVQRDEDQKDGEENEASKNTQSSTLSASATSSTSTPTSAPASASAQTANNHNENDDDAAMVDVTLTESKVEKQPESVPAPVSTTALITRKRSKSQAARTQRSKLRRIAVKEAAESAPNSLFPISIEDPDTPKDKPAIEFQVAPSLSGLFKSKKVMNEAQSFSFFTKAPVIDERGRARDRSVLIAPGSVYVNK